MSQTRPPWLNLPVRSIEDGLKRGNVGRAARVALAELVAALLRSTAANRDLADALARHRRDTTTLVDEITDQRDRADDEIVRLRRLLDQREAA